MNAGGDTAACTKARAFGGRVVRPLQQAAAADQHAAGAGAAIASRRCTRLASSGPAAPRGGQGADPPLYQRIADGRSRQLRDLVHREAVERLRAAVTAYAGEFT